MAENKYKKDALLNFETNALEAKEDTDKLKESLNETNESYKDLNKTTEKYNKTADENSKSLNELGKNIANNSALTGVLDKATGGLYSTIKNTITQAFNYGKSLTGVSVNQKAVTVSTNASSTAMKGFRTALLSTGVGALVVALGYLVGKMIEFSESVKENNKEMDINKVKIDALKRSYEELGDVMEFSYFIDMERAKRSGADETELARLRTKYSEERIKNIGKEIESLEKQKENTDLSIEQYSELNKRISELSKAQTKIFDEELREQERDKTRAYESEQRRIKEQQAQNKAELERRKKERETELKDIEDSFKKAESLSKKYEASGYRETGLTASQSSSVFALKEERKQIEDEVAKVTESFLRLDEAGKKAMQESFDNFKNTSARTVEQIETQLDELYNSFSKEKLDALDSLMKQYTEKTAIQYADTMDSHELERARKFNVSLIEIQKEKALQEAELLEASNAQKFEIEQAFNDKILEENRKNAEATKRINDIKTQSYLSMTSETSGLISGLSDVAKEGTGVQKGLAIASVLLDTGASAIATFKAYVSSFPAPYGQIAGGIASASAIVMGMKQVANLKKVKTDGTEAGGQSSSGIITASSQPNVSFVSSSENQIQTAIADSSEMRDETPIKTYVVASDVTTAQELERKAIENNSL